MKLKLMLFAVYCLLSASAFGQSSHLSVYQCANDSLAGTLDFPGILSVEPLLWSPLDNRLFVSGGGDLWVIDCAADTITDYQHYWFGDKPCVLDTTDNKLYFQNFREVGVYDCEAESITAAISVVRAVWDMVWSVTADRIYVSHGSHDTLITVIDCHADSVIGYVHGVGLDAYRMCVDDASGKLYFGQGAAIGVIDVSSDSIIHRVYLPGSVVWLLTNPVSHRLYVQTDGGDIYVLDCGTDSIVDSFAIRSTDQGGIDPVRNRMYLFLSDTLNSVDLTTGQILTIMAAGPINTMVLDTNDSKVYAFMRDELCFNDTVWVLDADSGVTLRVLHVPDVRTCGVVWNPLMNKVYLGGDDEVGAVASRHAPAVTNGPRLPTITQSLPPGAVVFDAMGRRVTRAKTGVYFVVTSHPDPLPQGERERTTRAAVGVRKVVIQH
jgi:DNA-binding beta-propeller fold protein YncE